MKKIIGKIHLWLGLASGLVVFIVATTGCIYAFQEEIKDFTQPYRFVNSQKGNFLPPSVLKQKTESYLKGKEVRRVTYNGHDRSAEALLYGEGGYYYGVNLNPYTGEIINVQNLRTDFFTIILYLHISLLLPGKIGTTIVGYSTLIFLVLLISGIILWWPKNKSAAKQRFSIKWNARWRRKNYDLHNVLGFYMSWIVIFIAITGLVWSFEWVSNSIYWISSGGKSMLPYESPISDSTLQSYKKHSAIDIVWTKVIQENNPKGMSSVEFPYKNTDPITIMYNPKAGTYYKLDYRYFDQYSMKELNVKHTRGKYKNTTLADKINRMNYDIHVGAILGLPGKFLVFFASLIAASLPITGIIIWRGRKKEKKTTTLQKKESTLYLQKQF